MSSATVWCVLQVKAPDFEMAEPGVERIAARRRWLRRSLEGKHALIPSFDGLVSASAKRSKDGPQSRRLLALAAIYDGATRTEAAKIGGVTLQIIRDWVMRLNALGPDGLCFPGYNLYSIATNQAAIAALFPGRQPLL